jgi:hypothetical protein
MASPRPWHPPVTGTPRPWHSDGARRRARGSGRGAAEPGPAPRFRSSWASPHVPSSPDGGTCGPGATTAPNGWVAPCVRSRVYFLALLVLQARRERAFTSHGSSGGEMGHRVSSWLIDDRRPVKTQVLPGEISQKMISIYLRVCRHMRGGA